MAASTQSLTVPALRQSIFEQMGCPFGYSLVHIQGMKMPNTLESQRGTEVHDVLAQYASHCAHQRIPGDYAYLDALIASGIGDEAAGILESCRENLTVDWSNFMGAEIAWGLDADFGLTWSYDHDGNRIEMNEDVWGCGDSGNEPEHCGIFDAIYLMPGGKFAVVDDYKSHPRPFPANTFQGKLYALALLLHLPELNQVTFKLRFVRYANVHTEHAFYRSDVPKLMEDVRRVRKQQVEIHAKHAAGETLACHGGAHCTYCPGAQAKLCPIADLNPMLNMSPADRLSFRLWLDVANRTNNKAMQMHVDGTGETICSTDANGKHYTFGPVEKQKVTYPLLVPDGAGGWSLPIVDALLDWAYTNPEDLRAKGRSKPWFSNLRIGSTQLKSYLKAKKREIIDNRIKDLALTENKIELRVERDAEIDDGQGEEHRDFEEQEF